MINGNFKFFEPSKALFKNDDTVVVSSGSNSANNLIDFNQATRWSSIGSNDSTTETITLTFNVGVVISRLLLLNHNFEDYTVQFYGDNAILDGAGDAILDGAGDGILDGTSSSVTYDFDNVISVESSTPVTGITESGYTLNSSYYEFDATYCTGLIITITTAQPAGVTTDQEKYCYRVVPTIEVNDNDGTLSTYPVLEAANDFYSNQNRSVSGQYLINKLANVFVATINFILGNNQTDLEIVENLRYRTEPFLIYPNGGKLTINESTTYYHRFNTAPYRLKDLYNVQVSASNLPVFTNNVMSNPYSLALTIREVN